MHEFLKLFNFFGGNGQLLQTLSLILSMIGGAVKGNDQNETGLDDLIGDLTIAFSRVVQNLLTGNNNKIEIAISSTITILETIRKHIKSGGNNNLRTFAEVEPGIFSPTSSVATAELADLSFDETLKELSVETETAEVETIQYPGFPTPCAENA